MVVVFTGMVIEVFYLVLISQIILQVVMEALFVGLVILVEYLILFSLITLLTKAVLFMALQAVIILL